MEEYGVVIILLAVSIGLSPIATKLKIPYPILLLATGIAVGFIPGFHQVSINPEVVFLIFLPPLLFDAAFKISFKDFKANLHTISYLAITLIFITTTGIAVVAHYCIPGMTWPLAFVVGAILSPPDAIAASGVTQGLNLPHRTQTILEGESLVNDASALVAFRFAVAAVAGSTFILWQAALMFFVSLLGGCLVGIILWFLYSSVVMKIKLESPVMVSLTLLLSFVAYLIAEELHVSGVIAVVTIGLTVSRHKHILFTEQAKIQSKSFWEIGIFILNGLVFILIGLEFPSVLRNIKDEPIGLLTGCAVLIFFVALIIRMVIIFWHKKSMDNKIASFQKRHARIQQHIESSADLGMRNSRKLMRMDLLHRKRMRNLESLSIKDCIIIGWSGMRGIVSLAAALSLPLVLANGSQFPLRDTILFLTAVVVIIMLIVQGLGLPLLIKLLKI